MTADDRARNRTASERHRIAVAALAEAERTARSARSDHPGQDQGGRAATEERAARTPDPRDLRGRWEGARSRRRKATEPDPDRHADVEADPESVAREIVLRKLTAQQRSRAELAKALKERDVPDDAADAVLDRMEDVGLVDDAELAQTWVRSRQSRRGLSRRALRQELVRKGVARDDIDDALSGVSSEDELAAATALAEKKLRSMAGLEREVKYRRLAGALARRGFSAGLTSQVLGSLLDQ